MHAILTSFKPQYSLMALHIQMSEEAEAELKRVQRRNKLSSMAACLAFILFGGGIMFFTAIYIAIEQEAEFITYVAPQDNAPPKPTPTTPQLTSKQSSPSNAVAPSVIVANTAAPVAMAQVDVPMDDSMDNGMGLDLGMGLGNGLGDGLGDGGDGLGSTSGGGSALEGTFYDLKQTKSGATVASSPGETARVLSEFVKAWSPSVLSKYYQSPTKLYATNFCLPSCKAEYAPIAYECKDKVKPSGWVAVYRGRVKAPKSGTFRFAGTGDDLLAVKFNGKMVLEAGWCIPSTYGEPGDVGTRGSMNNPAAQEYHKKIADGKDSKHKGYEFITRPELAKWSRELGGLTAGTEFTVKEGQTIPIEVLISEVPGGAFGFVLLIQEKVDGKYDNNKFDLFRTNFSTPNKESISQMINKENCGMGAMEFPNYNEDSPIWVAVP